MIEPLDLQTLLVNTLSGNAFIFAAIMLMIIAGMAAKFKRNSMLFGLILLLFSAIMDIFLPWLWVLTLILFGFIFFYNLKKIISPN